VCSHTHITLFSSWGEPSGMVSTGRIGQPKITTSATANLDYGTHYAVIWKWL